MLGIDAALAAAEFGLGKFGAKKVEFVIHKTGENVRVGRARGKDIF